MADAAPNDAAPDVPVYGPFLCQEPYGQMRYGTCIYTPTYRGVLQVADGTGFYCKYACLVDWELP